MAEERLVQVSPKTCVSIASSLAIVFNERTIRIVRKAAQAELG
jgi:hypothetical protein